MVHIDSRAVIHPKAELGENVTVAPFAIIGEDVKIGDNTYIGPMYSLINGSQLVKITRFTMELLLAHRHRMLSTQTPKLM